MQNCPTLSPVQSSKAKLNLPRNRKQTSAISSCFSLFHAENDTEKNSVKKRANRSCVWIRRIDFKGNLGLFWRRGAARREWIFLVKGTPNVVFIFFNGTVMVKLTFSHCKKSKAVTYFLPGFSSLKRDVLGAVIRNGSSRNFEIVFFKYHSGNVTPKFFCFNLFSSAPEKPHVDPKTHCFWDEMNLSRWIYVGFLRIHS